MAGDFMPLLCNICIASGITWLSSISWIGYYQSHTISSLLFIDQPFSLGGLIKIKFDRSRWDYHFFGFRFFSFHPSFHGFYTKHTREGRPKDKENGPVICSRWIVFMSVGNLLIYNLCLASYPPSKEWTNLAEDFWKKKLSAIQ